ncbi:hypothetical protein GC176_17885 [bacterium]|nr:hypothetical protein [bacterium]
MTPKHHHRRNCNEPAHAHGLTFSCYQRFRFLQAERTCQWLPEAIDEARKRWGLAALDPSHPSVRQTT